MPTINISLPEQMREFVEARVSDGGYTTTSEYFRDLVREDQKQKERAKLEALLLAGIESGNPVEVNAEFWEERKATLLANLQKEQSRGA